MADVAFLFERGLVTAGPVLVHMGRARSATPVGTAGWIGPSATAACPFGLRSSRAGDFDRAGPAPALQRLAPAGGTDTLTIAVRS